MFSWENGTEIAIWGTGKRARKFYLRYRYYFKVVNFIDNFPKKSHNIRETVLSMGMSGSYELAIEEGATMVRVGSAIFGQRNYP